MTMRIFPSEAMKFWEGGHVGTLMIDFEVCGIQNPYLINLALDVASRCLKNGLRISLDS